MVIPVAPLLAANAAFKGPLLAFGPITKAVSALYGVATDLDDFMNRHIREMQSSDNLTIATTGAILEKAKFGFGLYYMSSVAIIAVGQFLLGNTFSAVVTVATAATLSNPIAMTCGAVGAIVYGWSALNDVQRNSILELLATGLEIGVELIKSIISFVISAAKALFSSQTLKDLKHFIAEKAALFGRSLSDVTHATVDVISDTAASAKRHAEVAIAGTVKVAGVASNKVGEKLSDIGRVAGLGIDHAGAATKQAIEGGKDAIDHAGAAAKQVIQGGMDAIRRVRSDKSKE